MSISALSGSTPTTKPPAEPQQTARAPAVTAFGQELDAQVDKAAAARGHHHHQHSGASQSVASAPSSAASAAGIAPSNSVASSLLHLLS